MTDLRPTIAIIGGTGALGSGLAARLALAGYPVVLGSRDAAKAQAAAAGIAVGNGAPAARGDSNAGAAAAAEIVVVAVPWSNHDATLDDLAPVLAGKIVVDAVVPLVPPKVAQVQLPPGGSAGQIAQARLGEGVRVVSAFHNVSAAKLQGSGPVECDVLVCGDDRAAREAVIALCAPIGLTGIDAGPIANSAAAEALTSVLIGINRRYKVPGAGLRITGLPAAGEA